MAKLSLIRFDHDGLELFVDQVTGRAYAGINATARMCGRNESTVRSLVSARGFDLLEAEIQTVKGLQSARLLSSEQVFEVALKYCPELARKMGAAGANVYMCGVAGYQVQVARPKTALELAREQVKLLEAIELKNAQIVLLQETTERQAEVIDELFDYSSIIRIAKYNGCDEKAFSWYKLKAASQALGLDVKKAPCPRFVTKNLYSHDAWRLAYPGYRLPETMSLTIQAPSPADFRL